MLMDDDSIEPEHEFSSAESLPVNWQLDLAKIWIPSSCLPNRNKQRNTNENKPFILYTLERPDYSKTFSVYSDECHQSQESQASSSVSPRISHHRLIIQDKNRNETQRAFPFPLSELELNAILDIGSEDVCMIPPMYPEKSNSSHDSLRGYHETNESGIRNATQLPKEASDSYSKQEARHRTSLDDLTRRMAEILSEDEPVKENWHHENVIESSHFTTSSTLDSIPPSAKDSLEELYYSEEDEFAVEYQDDIVESPERKPICSLYTENSYGQEQPFEGFVSGLKQAKSSSEKTDIYTKNSYGPELPFEDFVNGLEQAKNGCDKTDIYAENSYGQEQPFESFVKSLEQAKLGSDKIEPQSSERLDKIHFENQKDAVDKVFSQNKHGDFNETEFVVHTKDYEQETFNCDEKSEDPTEIVPELPIAYKRPPLQEQTNKTKHQKEKKKAKKAKINIPLEDLFQSEEVDRFKVPEVDEFYENLVRQGKCQEINIDGFPSVNYTEKLQLNEMSSINLQDQSLNSFWNSAEKFRQSLCSESQSDSPKEIKRSADVPQDKEKVKPELESKDSFETLIMDNIPLNVSRENIESFILGFGVPRNLIIKQYGKFQRAKFQMDVMPEVDWVIDCLNDSQPFGSSDKELIKCYRQT